MGIFRWLRLRKLTKLRKNVDRSIKLKRLATAELLAKKDLGAGTRSTHELIRRGYMQSSDRQKRQADKLRKELKEERGIGPKKKKKP